MPGRSLKTQVSGPRREGGASVWSFLTWSGSPSSSATRPQSVDPPGVPPTLYFVSITAFASWYSVWNSFAGVSRSGSRRAQKIFWNSSRSDLSFRSL